WPGASCRDRLRARWQRRARGLFLRYLLRGEQRIQVTRVPLLVSRRHASNLAGPSTEDNLCDPEAGTGLHLDDVRFREAVGSARKRASIRNGNRLALVAGWRSPS